MKNRIIAFLLIITSLFSLSAIYASAAKGEEYVSEVALIYEDSVEDALEEIAGTDWKLFETNLNANADYLFDNGVYLIYKTTTDVEEAITDLRVMDMYGGYNISNYQRQLEASREEYLKIANGLRVIANEFRTAYIAGAAMASLAKTQMNFYKDTKTEGGTETDMLMGEFFMNMPSDDQIIQVLMEGNTFAVSNLITLLAIGISGSDETTLADRIAEKYAIKNTLSDALYYDDALTLYNAFENIRAKLLRYDTLSAEYDLTDEDMTDEEFTFMTEYASIAQILKEIVLDKTEGFTLADVIHTGTYTYKDFYPIAAALTEGQMALVELGQIETILRYGAPSASTEELRQYLNEYIEFANEEFGDLFSKGIDVYTGVDRSIFKGSFAMTSEAERNQALTGKTWDMDSAVDDSTALIAISGVLAGLAAIPITYGLGVAAVTYGLNLAGTIVEWFHLGYMGLGTVLKCDSVLFFSKWAMFSWGGLVLPVTVALLVLAAGFAGISIWYNYYNPDYLEIPNTMIDVVDSDLGDKYVKYTAAKVYDDNGALSEKNADFNAYEGKEWVALYYTKDATAGKCLTPNFVAKESDGTIARRHQGISMFGETKAYNLNSHVYDDDAKSIYVTIRYSTAKKAAATLPTVVGSIFSDGALYALTSLGGAVIGAGAVLALGAIRKKNKNEDGDSEAIA